MTMLQEYGLEIKLEKIIWGQGHCRLATKSEGSQIDEETCWKNEVEVSIK